MKKKILTAALALICMAVVGYGTYAWLTVRGTTRNVITTGGIDITILEQQLSDGKLIPYPSSPVSIMPGSSVSKIVSVRNDEKTAYIRMKYDLIFLDADGNKMDIDPETASSLITVSGTSTSWIEHEGWWYYNTAIDVGQVSEPFFETVSFSAEDMNNIFQNSTIKIVIYAHAVQTANNPAPNGDVTAIKGWPKN